MIVSTLIAATVAAAQPAPAPKPDAAPAPAADKKMACCKDMAKGDGCCCCKDKAGDDAAAKHDHGAHKH